METPEGEEHVAPARSPAEGPRVGLTHPSIVGGAAALFASFFAYYVLKALRDPLLLADVGHALERRTAAAAVQAVVLLVLLPIHGASLARFGRARTSAATGWGFTLTLIALAVTLTGGALGPTAAFAFHVWTGLYGVFSVAQIVNAVTASVPRRDAKRLLPALMTMAPLGALAGALVTALGPSLPVLFGAALVASALASIMTSRAVPIDDATASSGIRPIPEGGRADRSTATSLGLLAIVVLVASATNTLGELLLAQRATSLEPVAELRGFFGVFHATTALVSLGLQLALTFVLRRLAPEKLDRVTPWLLASAPLASLASLGAFGVGAPMVFAGLAKATENAIEYTTFSTGKALFGVPLPSWLRDRAKLAIDTLLVRFGDLLAAGVFAAVVLVGGRSAFEVALFGGLLSLVGGVAALLSRRGDGAS